MYYYDVTHSKQNRNRFSPRPDKQVKTTQLNSQWATTYVANSRSW